MTCFALLAAVAAMSAFAPTADALSEEEQQFLAAEVRAWLSSQAAGARGQHHGRQQDDSPFAAFMERRLRYSFGNTFFCVHGIYYFYVFIGTRPTQPKAAKPATGTTWA